MVDPEQAKGGEEEEEEEKTPNRRPPRAYITLTAGAQKPQSIWSPSRLPPDSMDPPKSPQPTAKEEQLLQEPEQEQEQERRERREFSRTTTYSEVITRQVPGTVKFFHSYKTETTRLVREFPEAAARAGVHSPFPTAEEPRALMSTQTEMVATYFGMSLGESESQSKKSSSSSNWEIPRRGQRALPKVNDVLGQKIT